VTNTPYVKRNVLMVVRPEESDVFPAQIMFLFATCQAPLLPIQIRSGGVRRLRPGPAS
jgi:hypothetical protein